MIHDIPEPYHVNGNNATIRTIFPNSRNKYMLLLLISDKTNFSKSNFTNPCSSICLLTMLPVSLLDSLMLLLCFYSLCTLSCTSNEQIQWSLIRNYSVKQIREI